MRLRTIRGLAAAALAVIGIGLFATNSALAQGNAFLVFDVDTGQLRMNPGSTTQPITGYTIDSNSAAGLTWNTTAVFPSGSYPFPATNTASRIGAAFYNLTAPNIVPNSSTITTSNLQLGTTGVVASTTPGFVGTAEWVFGNVGPTNLTLTAALNAFGATEQGGLSTGNRFYTQQGVTGNTQFRIYTVSAVPEPSTLMLGAGALATLGAAGWRRKLKQRAAAAAAA
ncbi:MAG: PEP-CTERM sorting domain-containing protein [Planctomycetia bacterium]